MICVPHPHPHSTSHPHPHPPWLCFPSPDTAPSAPPQEVHLVSLTSTSLQVSWVAPPADSRHGAIVQYTLSYQALAGEDTERHQVPHIGADATSYVLEGLEKWTEYQVWVRAHTDVGPGPESDPVRIRTKEDGRCWAPSRPFSSEPLVTVSPRSIQLLSLPAVPLINSELMRRHWYRAGTTPLLFLPPSNLLFIDLPLCVCGGLRLINPGASALHHFPPLSSFKWFSFFLYFSCSRSGAAPHPNPTSLSHRPPPRCHFSFCLQRDRECLPLRERAVCNESV